MKKDNFYIEFEGIGTHRYINIYDNISEELQRSITQKVMDFLHKFEDNYSRFRDHSLVSQLGKNGNLSYPPADFLQMLELAKKSEELSDGYFSILVANTLLNLGYGQNTKSSVAGISDINRSKIPPLTSVVSWDQNNIYIQKGRNIDLGGLGKGYLIDKFTEIFKNNNLQNFMINGGGDIYIQNPARELDSLIQDPIMYFQDPLDMTKVIGHNTVNKGGFASSSSYHRNRIKDNKKNHHLINPFKLKSSDSPLLGVYIYFPENAVVADIVSTIIYICPPQQVDIIAKRFGVEYLLVLANYQTIQSEGFPAVLYN